MRLWQWHFLMKKNVKDTAMYLRSCILQAMNTQQPLSSPLSVESIAAGQGERPRLLLDFLKTLFSASEKKLKDKYYQLLMVSCTLPPAEELSLLNTCASD